MINGEFDFHRIGKFFCLFIFRERKRLYHIKAPKHQKYTLTVSNKYKPSNYPERFCRIVFLVWEIFREVCSLLIRTSFSFYAQTTWEEPMLYLNGRRRIPKQTLYLKKTSILICLSPYIRHYLKGFLYAYTSLCQHEIQVFHLFIHQRFISTMGLLFYFSLLTTFLNEDFIPKHYCTNQLLLPFPRFYLLK